MQVKFRNLYTPSPSGVVPVKKGEKISEQLPEKLSQKPSLKKSTNKQSQEPVSFSETLGGNVDING